MVDCTVSGELPPSDLPDLRLLLRIKGQGALGQISELLPDGARAEYERLSTPFRVAIRTLDSCGIEWRGRAPRSVMPSSYVLDLRAALALAHEATAPLHVIDGTQELADVARLFERAEWEGVSIDMGIGAVPERFLLDGRLHPQIDVIPRELTGRMGTRGGFNVMAWKHSTRGALHPDPGKSIYSIDFNAMDLHSLTTLDEVGMLRSMVSQDDDAYTSLSRSVFGATGEQLRGVLKGSFLPFAYGAGIQTVADSLGISADSAMKLWDRYRPWLKQFIVGPDLARLVQETSSTVFRAALAAAGRSSICDLSARALFPVHDELVMESDSDSSALYVKSLMERTTESLTGVRYRTVVKRGNDYGHMEKLC